MLVGLGEFALEKTKAMLSYMLLCQGLGIGGDVGTCGEA